MAIREIRIKGNIKTGNISLAYPDYINKQGRSIPQVEIVNESLAKAIRQAIVAGAAPANLFGGGAEQKQVDFNYKIAKISLLRQKDQRLKAFVQVLFNEAIRVEARVMESKTGLWVAWPGHKGSSGQWRDQFKVLDYSASQKLDNAIIEKYKVVRSEEP
jgi:stage V sporulation protein G